MLDSLLIANRGEIACRVIRTARALGVRTVAVYSDADRGALHTRLADVAVHIGAAPAKESYLVQERILSAAEQTGASAIHPGYGFLSENPEFADAVKAAGLIWVGPPASSIRAMGLKDAAKRLMSEAGVPVTPGYLGADQSAERLQKEADAIGYPVLIKAVAGGGGKGMRKVERAQDFAAALTSCRREAAASFGDDRVLLEKYVTRPRHIEVQVFADQHGNAVHLFERDCSLQRRHQKVIEEAPAPGMDAATREAVCGAAVRAARAVGYEGAGTVEFIADGSEGLRADRIWFMEMNTRLQVEHPVTESITGVDLVEWQLRVASGEPLPKAQEELAIQGHAMEARLYAENPTTGFLPSTGPLTHLHLPTSIRVDTGVVQGSEVTPFYDPMIAKLIVHAPSRRAAAAKLSRACADVQVWPIKTNAAFLARAAAHGDFVEGRVDTGFIERHLDQLVPAAQVSAEVLATAALSRIRAGHDVWNAKLGFRLNAPARVEVEVQTGSERQLVTLGDVAYLPSVRVAQETVVFEHGEAITFQEPQWLAESSHGASEGTITATMPGKIIAIQVADGDAVKKGQPLITMEAMKMEHTLRRRSMASRPVSSTPSARKSQRAPSCSPFSRRARMTLPFEPIELEPAYRKVAGAMIERITAGAFKRGDRLPSELELAKQFGVNRGTIREALRELQTAGLLTRARGSKLMMVTRPQADHVAENVGRALVLHDVTFLNVWESMSMFEPPIAESAAKKRTAPDLAVLLKAHESFVAHGTPQYVAEFFSAIAAATHNPVLAMTQEPLIQLLEPSLGAMIDKVAQARTRIATAQRRICEAIQARNAEAARTWMTKHVRDFRRGYELAGIDLDLKITI